ncbi:MAG TPA: C4-type zinc ribbon domain-containing protein [Vicinamibacterales bacterium]
MDADLERLIQLQALDTQAAEARRAQTAIPETQRALDAKLEGARHRVAAEKERLDANQAARRALEKDLAAVQTRLSRYKDQLMEVKTNREYHAMQHEIEAAQGEVKRLEDLMLERMLEADDITAALKRAEADLKAAEAQIRQEHADLDRELEAAAATLTRTQQEREVLAAGIPKPLLALYEQVARARRGLAVVPARDGLCSECHVRLRPQVFAEVRQNSAIIQCDSCQRILYYVPPQAAAPADSGASA